MTSASSPIFLSTDTAPVGGIDALMALLADDMAAVNQLIVDRMVSDVPLIPQLAGYLVAAGGKRLRPLLTLAAARACGYRGTHHQLLATCVEFIHTATLLHDDVVDESDQRRGQESANAVWGNQASVLVGDFLFSRAFELMVDTGSLEVLRILSHASAVIAEGEVLQLATTGDVSTTRQAYLKVIEGKTAALFRAACEVGPVIANADAATTAAWASYGHNLGNAFQIADDILDYDPSRTALGKSHGNDFREGKMTLPVVLAIEAGTAEEHVFWRRTMAELDQREDDLDQALAILDRHQALDGALAIARDYADAANGALAPFGDTPLLQALREAARYSAERAARVAAG